MILCSFFMVLCCDLDSISSIQWHQAGVNLDIFSSTVLPCEIKMWILRRNSIVHGGKMGKTLSVKSHVLIQVWAQWGTGLRGSSSPGPWDFLLSSRFSMYFLTKCASNTGCNGDAIPTGYPVRSPNVGTGVAQIPDLILDPRLAHNDCHAKGEWCFDRGMWRQLHEVVCWVFWELLLGFIFYLAKTQTESRLLGAFILWMAPLPPGLFHRKCLNGDNCASFWG